LDQLEIDWPDTGRVFGLNVALSGRVSRFTTTEDTYRKEATT